MICILLVAGHGTILETQIKVGCALWRWFFSLIRRLYAGGGGGLGGIRSLRKRVEGCTVYTRT